jgi:LmbE family N-acetylglucosaminyl deacetylase
MKIPKNSRSIFLSPHPDDAALSCGGSIILMAQRAERPIVVTLFSGDRSDAMPLSDFARDLHARWQLSDHAPAERRAEDQAALDRLHATLLSLPFADAVYRLDPVTQQHLYDSEAAIFGSIRETTIIDQVADALRSAITPIENAGEAVQLFAPLAAGQHVDHMIARAAAERLTWPLVYYEDFPYAEDAAKLEPVWGADDWEFETIELDTDALQAKAESIARHRSQLSTFFKNEAEIEQRIRAYAQAVGGGKFVERYWRKV